LKITECFRYKVDESLLAETRKYLKESEKFAKSVKASKANSKEVGGDRHVSRQGAVSLSYTDWQDWVKFLKSQSSLGGQKWEKFFPSRDPVG
jgi:hypothetical protein